MAPDKGESVDQVLSELYHILRAPRRREVIKSLTTTAECPVSVRQLAREVTAREQASTLQTATGEPYRNTYNALSQTHLPALESAGVIIYDSDRQLVSRGQSFIIASLVVSITEPAVWTLLTEQRREDGEIG